MPKTTAGSQSNSASLVGTEALAYCTSCKMDLAHMIVAMKGDRIVKAQCKTCKKEHAYKAPKGVTEPPKEKAAKKTRSKKAAIENGDVTTIEVEWQKLMNQQKAPSKPYGTKGKFALGEKINHVNFGEGIISKQIYPNKIEVIFRDSIKILIHAGEPARMAQ